MKDLIIKNNHKKLDALTVIRYLQITNVFYDWIKKYDPVNKKIFSIKRLGKIFLAEYPSYYEEYDSSVNNVSEYIRLAQDHSCYED